MPIESGKQALGALLQLGIDSLAEQDPVLLDLLCRERDRQATTLGMVAASSTASPDILACEGSVFTNVTTEGYPGNRLHGGCEFADAIERLAIDRAKAAFGASYANVQPHSGSSANQILLFGFLKPGDLIMGLDLDSGGHLTHGSAPSVSGQCFASVPYRVGPDGWLDYEQIRDQALRLRPKLILCGASAYPREIGFARFREIADEAGALLLADISHIAGLVAAGCHPSPIHHAHFTTTSTYKQLYGPRGGLILIGREFETVSQGSSRTFSDIVQRSVFPLMQGTPAINTIAAKARALAWVITPEFRKLTSSIVTCAKALAEELLALGYSVLTGGTDNHIVLLDVGKRGLTGVIAQRALELCGITVNKNRIPGDSFPASITSGVRLGTNTLALRGMGNGEMRECARLLHLVLTAVRAHGPSDFELSETVSERVRMQIGELCRSWPLPGYRVSDVRARHDLAQAARAHGGLSNA
jgi:glycine hydroxymethyltransferase